MRAIVRRLFASVAPSPIPPHDPTMLPAIRHQVDLMHRELRHLARALLLPPPESWDNDVTVPPATTAPTGVFTHSTVCRQEHFDTPYYAYWAKRMAHPPYYVRKLWEFVFILQALSERGLLSPGRKGLGFGVGKEPLPALFATSGCEVLATDMAADQAVAAGWADSNQHAAQKEALRWPGICTDEEFETRVSFQPFDMTRTPGTFRDFDFCWSACALEHLGSLEAGFDFIERSLQCLKPGGIAVHTTEYNLSSNHDTVEQGPTVIYRRRDLEALAARLAASGHQLAPLDLREGWQTVDRYIDFPPYHHKPHLKLALLGHVATSVGLIVRRAPAS